MALATYAIACPIISAPRTRFDVIVGYTVLQRFRTAME